MSCSHVVSGCAALGKVDNESFKKKSAARATACRGRVVQLSSGILVCAVISGLTAAPASADALDGHQLADRIAAQVSTAAPDGAQAVLGTRNHESVEVAEGPTETVVPLNSDEPIEVAMSIAGQNVRAEISLPSGLSLGEGVLAADGTIVYPDDATFAEDAGAVAVQVLPGGDTRIETVIPSADAPHEFGYGMEGYRATINEGGEAAFVTSSSEGLYVPVESPWAADASGAAVETYYEVRGDELFQIVVAGPNTAYPVVADPTWGWRNAAWGLTLSRSETASIKDYGVAAAMCTALSQKAPVLAIGCGAWAGYALTQAVTANRQSLKGCLHAVVAPIPGAILHTHC